jgi:hypothetical protein
VKSTTPKSSQYMEGKKKQKKKKGKGNKKDANNVGEGKTDKRKVNYPCNICIDDHLNHLFPHLAKAQKLLA